MTATRRRAVPRVPTLLIAVAVLGVLGSEVGKADAPMKQGWWSKWQTSGPLVTVPAGAVPVETPGQVPNEVNSPSTVPPPPDSQPGGLTVAYAAPGPNDAGGPQAIAAMYFPTVEGADATLVLRPAPRKPGGTTPPDAVDGVESPDPAAEAGPDKFVLPPGAVVMACMSLSTWEPEMNGPWVRGPGWDSNACVPGTVSSDETSMFWSLPSSMQDLDGNYDVVLVPTGAIPPPQVPDPTGGDTPPVSSPGDSSYILNFAAPGGDTLVYDDTVVVDDPEPPGPDPEPGDGGPDDGDDGGGEIAFDALGPIDVPSGAGGFVAPALPTARPRAALSNTRPIRIRRLPFPLPDTRLEQIMAVSLLLFIALALWWLGGSPARRPRLLGAAGGRTVATAPAMPLLRGVGRFARERLGHAPRL